MYSRMAAGLYHILSLFWFLIRAISIKIILKSYVIILNRERSVIYEQ